MQTIPAGSRPKLCEFGAFERNECISVVTVSEKWPHSECLDLNSLNKGKCMCRYDYKVFVP